MRLKFVIIFGVLFILSAFTYPSRIHILNFTEFEPYLQQKDDNIYVINFWATWCKPCRNELPYFNQIRNKYKNQNVRVLLVSLDFPDQLETQLKPFLDNHKIEAKVVLLNEPDANVWINRVSKEWSGALPATLIYKKDRRKFIEGEITLDELEAEIKEFLKY